MVWEEDKNQGWLQILLILSIWKDALLLSNIEYLYKEHLNRGSEELGFGHVNFELLIRHLVKMWNKQWDIQSRIYEKDISWRYKYVNNQFMDAI